MVPANLTNWSTFDAGLPRIAALVGPTGSGKTALAVALRQAGLPVEAIGCDALQVYRGLDAATAKPTLQERAHLPYHLVDVCDPTEAMNAARWAELADAAIADVRARGAWPLVVGGTGLYLRGLVHGLAEIPPVPEQVRAELAIEWERRSPEDLHAELATVDPAYALKTPAANRQRVLRALEVYRATGKAFSTWHAEQAHHRRYACFTVVIEPARDHLLPRIEARARAMVPPLLQEVRALLDAGLSPEAPAMQALGYRDAVQALAEGTPAEVLADRLAHAHRKYAKRQMTWFRAEPADRHLVDNQAVSLLTADLRAWFSGEAAPRP